MSVCLAGLGAGLWSWNASRPAPLPTSTVQTAPAQTGTPTSSSSQSYVRSLLFQKLKAKVSLGVEKAKPILSQRPMDRPLVLALGSSSSGGQTAGEYWPQLVQNRLPEATVVTVALGGYTTWHLRRVLDALKVRPEVCVVYAGHNDRNASMPGASITELEKGAKSSMTLVPAVTLPEARENHLTMAAHCERYLAMAERVVGSEARMNEYAQVLQSLSGVQYLDVRTALASASDRMLDDVHPTPEGHIVLARLVTDRVRQLLAEPVSTP